MMAALFAIVTTLAAVFFGYGAFVLNKELKMAERNEQLLSQKLEKMKEQNERQKQEHQQKTEIKESLVTGDSVADFNASVDILHDLAAGKRAGNRE